MPTIVLYYDVIWYNTRYEYCTVRHYFFLDFCLPPQCNINTHQRFCEKEMIARFSIRHLVAFGATVASIHGHVAAVVAFQLVPMPVLIHLHEKSPRSKTNPFDGRNALAYIQDHHHERCASSSLLLAKFEGETEERGTVTTSKFKKRRRIMSFMGRLNGGAKSQDEVPTNAGPFRVKTVDELNDYYKDGRGYFRKRNGDINYSMLQASLAVEGDTQIIGSVDRKDVVHPVVQLLHKRKREIENNKRSQPAQNTGQPTNKEVSSTKNNNNRRKIYRTKPPEDGFRVALVIEGGGMSEWRRKISIWLHRFLGRVPFFLRSYRHAGVPYRRHGDSHPPSGIGGHRRRRIRVQCWNGDRGVLYNSAAPMVRA